MTTHSQPTKGTLGALFAIKIYDFEDIVHAAEQAARAIRTCITRGDINGGWANLSEFDREKRTWVAEHGDDGDHTGAAAAIIDDAFNELVAAGLLADDVPA